MTGEALATTNPPHPLFRVLILEDEQYHYHVWCLKQGGLAAEIATNSYSDTYMHAQPTAIIKICSSKTNQGIYKLTDFHNLLLTNML